MKQLLSIFCWFTVLLLWGCAATVYIDPSDTSKYISLIGLGFPFCVLLVVGTLVFCLVLRLKQAFIPLFGLIACYGSLRDYCPINLSSPPPKGCLKVLSYNTLSFGNFQKNEQGNVAIADYICAQHADIVCLQEAAFYGEENQENIQSLFSKEGYHYQWHDFCGVMMGVASRYPIARYEVICQSEGNGACAFYLTPSPQDTLIVVNTHLESMHLSSEERSHYHQIVRNPDKADEITGKRAVLEKIATSGRDRALQVNDLTQFLDRNKGRKLILMGDFNDTPISYAHHEICNRLTDAYRSTGNGIGRSFNKDAIYVRIDNIFCSEHWKPFAARIDASIPYSDHYPISAYLQPQEGKVSKETFH